MGTEGVVELTQWFKRMEIVFRISNYIVENQIKFATCTLLGSALTWWNSYVRTVGHVRTVSTEGVVELTQWFERMEIVFRISNYTVE
ncbi:hypothetical protein Tco_0521623, partial [Tanacetum coccineum]